MTLDTRSAAARAIVSVMAGKSLNHSLPGLLQEVEPRDQGLLQQLCYGTLRQLPRLEAIASQLLNKPLRNKDRDVQALLLLGLYQLSDTRVPDHAAVSTTVNAVGALKKPWAKGLVNAVLRRYVRQQSSLEAGLDEAAAAAHPRWLFDAISRQWPDQAQDIFQAGNSQPPMTLRINTRVGSRRAYLEKLARARIDAQAGALSSLAVTLGQAIDTDVLPGFAAGEVSVQDEAAQMAASVLDPQPGERILDACSAPGGKACHTLEREPALGELVAMDVDAGRLTKVGDNLQRLDLDATLLTGDASRPPASLEVASFDRILVDAPCSATGVIRRHPDVKVLRRQGDIGKLAKQQVAILEGLWPLLKPGGTLLYATCSILDEENSQVVAQFLQHNGDATPVPFHPAWGEARSHGRQLLPTPGGPDGLFYAVLHKAL